MTNQPPKQTTNLIPRQKETYYCTNASALANNAVAHFELSGDWVFQDYGPPTDPNIDKYEHKFNFISLYFNNPTANLLIGVLPASNLIYIYAGDAATLLSNYIKQAGGRLITTSRSKPIKPSVATLNMRHPQHTTTRQPQHTTSGANKKRRPTPNITNNTAHKPHPTPQPQNDNHQHQQKKKIRLTLVGSGKKKRNKNENRIENKSCASSSTVPTGLVHNHDMFLKIISNLFPRINIK